MNYNQKKQVKKSQAANTDHAIGDHMIQKTRDLPAWMENKELLPTKPPSKPQLPR